MKISFGIMALLVAMTFVATPTTFASDASAGNSYAAERVNFDVAPAAHAHITVKGQFGVAP